MSVIDKFMPLMMEREEEGTTAPIIQHGNITFVYIKYNNLHCILSPRLDEATALYTCKPAIHFVQLYIKVQRRKYMILTFKIRQNVAS